MGADKWLIYLIELSGFGEINNVCTRGITCQQGNAGAAILSMNLAGGAYKKHLGCENIKLDFS